jgi:N-acetylneuraminic acid mutarotase
MRHCTLAAAVAVATLGLLSCERSPTAPRLDQLSLDVVSGNGQTAVVGSELAPLIVKVTSGGNPVSLQVLNFRVVSGGGSVYGGTALTDDHGIAQEIWTLGTNASAPQKVEVRAVESSTGAQKVFGTFTATATSAPASVISAQGGNGQTAVAGTQLPFSPTVLVTDQFGNAIAGVTVTFAVTGGAGSIVNQSQATATSGIASAGTWTLGPQAGPNTLTATSTGLNGNPVTFTAGGTAGSAAKLVVLSGNNQTSSPGSTLPNQPTVRVLDANGNGVPNVAVTFSVTGGGGSIGGVGSVTTLTGAGSAGLPMGSAAVSWTLGSAEGTNTLQATAVGLSGSPLVFSATGSAWTARASMPTGRWTAAAGVINGLLYVVGGSDATSSTASKRANEAYDPMTDAWVAKAPIQNGAGLAYAGAGVIAGKLYVVGGCFFSDCIPGNTNALEVYDPVADAWTTKAPMPTARNMVAVGVINGKLYVAGGEGQCGPCVPTSVLEVYDPSTDTWASKAAMPTARAELTAGVVNGILYVIGGRTGGGASASVSVGTVEAYDPATDTWTTRLGMPTPRQDAIVGVLNGMIYVAGGYSASSGSVLNAVEAYDPIANAWTTKQSMPTARSFLSGGVVGGVLFAVGGNTASGPVATNEAFRP